MLNVEERFMIKDLYRKGCDISEIAGCTGHDRKTIRADRERAGQRRRRRSAKPRASKLDPFVPHLKKRIDEGVLNCNKLLGRDPEPRLPGRQEPGQELRAALPGSPRQAQATVRFETEPGEQAQVDWGHFGFIEHQGRQRRLYAFVMTLGWSRAMYLEFTVSADAAWWLRCHLHAFQYFGGVPREVLHDNLKTAVLEPGCRWQRALEPALPGLRRLLRLHAQACQPYRAQTKGKVESGRQVCARQLLAGPALRRPGRPQPPGPDWLDRRPTCACTARPARCPSPGCPWSSCSPLLGKPDYDTSLISLPAQRPRTALSATTATTTRCRPPTSARRC